MAKFLNFKFSSRTREEKLLNYFKSAIKIGYEISKEYPRILEDENYLDAKIEGLAQQLLLKYLNKHK